MICSVSLLHCWASTVPQHLDMLPEMLNRHPAIKMAVQQKLAAEQETESARWQFFPTPSLGFERSNQSMTFTDSTTRYFRLQQPIWTGGRLHAQLDRAVAQEAQFQANWFEQQHNIANRWLESWAEVAAAKLRIQAHIESEQQHKRYVSRVQAQADAGQIASNEVQLSLTRLALVQAELELATVQHQQAFNRLQQMWGGFWPEMISFELPFNSQPLLELSKLQKMALETHPMIHKNQALIKLTESDVELAQARLMPEVYARAEIVRGDVTHEVKRTFIGMTSSWGGGLSSLNSVSAAQNRLLAQEQEMEVRRKELIDVIASDYFQHIGQMQRFHQFQQAFKAADAYLLASEAQFSAGRRSWQELMNSAREKAQIRVQLADTQAQVWLIRERLHLNTQGLRVYLENTTP